MRKYHIIFYFLILTFISCTESKVSISTDNSSELVNLPDGSVALLNQYTSIAYDQNFLNRTIKQEGEVFYVVTKGESAFIIKTDKGDIEVLGTEFNVKSTAEELEVEVEKGSVRMKVDKLTRNIKKGQKAILADIENGIKIGKAELKHKKWTKKLEKQLGKFKEKARKNAIKIDKESKKVSKKIKKGLKKLEKQD